MSPTGDRIEISSRKHQVLIAMLALSGEVPVSRSRLAGMLWGEQTEKQAQLSLRQALFVIRHATEIFEERLLTVTHQACCMARATVETDIDMVLSDAESGSQSWPSLDVDGDFLEGLHFAEEGLDTWLQQERGRLRERLVRYLFRVAERLGQTGDGDRAMSTVQNLLRHDPYHEPSHRIVLNIHLQRGERRRALKYYASLCALLQTDLNVVPDSDTQALVQAILRTGKPMPVASPVGRKPRLAVLHAICLDAEGDGGPVADGLTRKLASEIARFSPISVVAATTMIALKGQHLSVEETGRQVKADYLLEVTFQGEGATGWTLAQLVHVESGTQIWSTTYTGETPHSTPDEDRLVRLISGNLYQFLMKHAADIDRRNDGGEASGEILYRQAFYHVERPTREGMVTARALCNRLLASDPEHVLVRECLAWVNFHCCHNGWLDDPLQGFYEARDVTAAGLRLDNQEPYLLSAFGLAQTYLGNLNAGLAALEKAVTLNPSDAEFHTWLGIGQTIARRIPQAHAAFDEADRLSPDYPPILLFRGDAFFTDGDHDNAIACLDRFLSILPEYHWARLLRAAACRAQGYPERAAQDMSDIRSDAPRLDEAYLARLLYARDARYSAQLLEMVRWVGSERDLAP